MANSGSFTTTACEGRSLTFNWSVKSQNVANNQTTITWNLTGSGSYTAGWVTCGNFKVTIDGKQVYYSLDDNHVIEIFNISIMHTNHKAKENDYEK